MFRTLTTLLFQRVTPEFVLNKRARSPDLSCGLRNWTAGEGHPPSRLIVRGAVLAAALLPLLLGGSARAGFVFEFADDLANTPTSSFTVAAGGTITIDVLLAEAAGETGFEISGLSGAGVRVTASAPADAAQLTDVAANSQFDFSTVAVVDSVGTGHIVESAFFNTLTGTAIYLGSFTFQVPTGASAGEVTTMTTGLPDLVVNEQDNFLNDGTWIDPLIANGHATITVSGAASPQPVPEPSTFLLVSVGLAGFLGGAGRRRAGKKAPSRPSSRQERLTKLRQSSESTLDRCRERTPWRSVNHTG